MTAIHTNTHELIAPMSQSPVQVADTAKMSAIELDQQLVDAFEAFDFERTIELVKAGANPNQQISLDFKMVLEFLKATVFAEIADNSEMDWDAILAQLVEHGNLQDLLDDYFGGQQDHSILFLSVILRAEDLAIALLENQANPVIEFGQPEMYSCNIIQVAASINGAKLMEHLLQTTSTPIHLSEIEGGLSPLEIALSTGAFDVFKVMVELRRNEVMKLLIEKDAIRQVFTDSTDPSIEPYRQLLIEHGFPISAPQSE